MSESDRLAFARTRLGRVLRGKYRLDRILGVGGMAVVYAATHRNKKRFAIKMLHPELSVHDSIRTRFLREGYIANSVRHPGAIAILDDDVAEDGSAFVVMELLDGQTVEALWQHHHRRIPIESVLSIGDALLDVLIAAHDHGVVHRDIKPSNLFLTYDGKLEVLDFGIAQLHDDTSADATATGAMLGTPGYMAPEQALGDAQNIDAQTDLWAVGATLFSLVTGELVHPATTGSSLVITAATRPARALSSVAEQVPSAVTAVINRALAFEKRDRWPDAKQMRSALQEASVAATGAAIEPLPTTQRPSGLEDTIVTPDLTTSPAPADTAPSAAAPAPQVARRSVASSPGPRGSRARLAVAITVPVAAVVVVVAVVASRGGTERDRSPVDAALAAEVRAGRPPATPAAAAAFEAAVQAEHDGNLPVAARSRAEATAADPTLAAAFLRSAIQLAAEAGDDRAKEGDASAAYHAALDHRLTLGDLDTALLEAYEPRFRAPPDHAEVARRFVEAAKRYPSDARVQTLLADNLRRAARLDEAQAASERALALDPTYVPAFVSELTTLVRRGDGARAHHVVDQCVAASVSAVSCLEERLKMDDDDGRCADVEADAKRLIAIDHGSTTGYTALAEGLAAQGAPIESVAEALRRANASIDPVAKQLAALGTTEAVDILQGDLGGAEAADAEAVQVASTKPELDAISLSLKQLAIVVEEGDHARARTLAKAVRARIDASGSSVPDIATESLLATLLHRAGVTTRAQLRATQTHLVDYQHQDDERRGGKTDPFRTWTWVYGNDIEDEGDAADALAALAAAGGPDAKFDHLPYYAQGLGTTYAFSGRGSDAVPYLELVEASCYQLTEAMDLAHDAFALGVAEEQTGDVAAARAAYQKVLDRWGKARPRSVTADRARARLAALAAKH